MKRIYLMGGLGNQLFQYSFLRYCQSVLPDQSFVLSTAWYKCQKNLQIHEQPKLHSLIPDISYEDDISFIEKLFFTSKFVRLLFRFPLLSSLFRFYIELSHPTSDLNIDLIASSNSFVGFWHDSKYCLSIRNTPLFSKQYINSQLKSFLNPSGIDSFFSSSLPFVSIHIRRGDFLTRSQSDNSPYKVLNSSYYQTSLASLFDKFSGRANLIFFSDDNSWLNQNYLRLIPTSLESRVSSVYFASEYCSTDIDEFYLMLFTDYIIAANSTFSWWPAFINSLSDPDSVVIPASLISDSTS